MSDGMRSMREYYGEIKPCPHCSNAKGIPAPCHHCFSRGFLATCMSCNGTSKKIEPMAGGPGNMEVPCAVCGGTGFFGVNKPEGWVEPAPATDKKLEPATA
jgi:hypothetical protein